jgi:hypothetical protein
VMMGSGMPNFSRPMAETILNRSLIIWNSTVCQLRVPILPFWNRVFHFAEQKNRYLHIRNRTNNARICQIVWFWYYWRFHCRSGESVWYSDFRIASKAHVRSGWPRGKAIYASEFRGLPSVSDFRFGNTPLTVGVFSDFPDNSRLTNSIYFPFPRLVRWTTGALAGITAM